MLSFLLGKKNMRRIRAEPGGFFILHKFALAQTGERKKNGNNHFILHQCSCDAPGVPDQQSQPAGKNTSTDGIQT